MKNHRTKGFTLIETLVAISILMIAIAGPLTIANKAYTASLDARNQTIGIYLAQDAIEYANAIKDNYNTFSYFTGCTSANKCGVSGITGADPFDLTTIYTNNIGLCANFNNCKIKTDSNLGYIYNSGTDTVFTRQVYFDDVSTGGTGDQYLVTAEVTWNTGSVSNQVVLKQLLTNYVR